MSNRDIERALALIPQAGPGVFALPDTREVALGKMKQLREWFDVALGQPGKSGRNKTKSPAGELSDEELLKGF